MTNRYYTSRLLKTIEPYNINGVNKCLFYTEINTNVKVGDKVFISNGVFDSEFSIYRPNKRHGKGVDGYNVLFVDRTKIVLDIDYVPVATYNIRPTEDFISVYKANTYNDFKYFTNIYIDTVNISRHNKFQKGYTNNILYIEDIQILDDSINNDPTIEFVYRQYTDDTFTTFTEITYNGTNPENFINSFYAKRDNNSNIYEVINIFFDRNGFKIDFGVPGSPNPNPSAYFYSEYTQYISTLDDNTIEYYKNPRLYIQNDDITYKGVTYIKRNIYRYTPIEGTFQWDIDVSFKQPILSKNFFKNGVFSGTHNNGIFGNYKSRKIWRGDNTWNSGFMLNSIWEDGTMNSITNTEESFYSTYDSNGQVVITSDTTNNKGFGYNYIIDSKIKKGTILNGNFINCEVSNDISMDIIESKILSTSISNTLTIKSGFYDLCDFKNTSIENAKIKDSYIENSYIKSSTINSNQILKSVCEQTIYNNENGITVLSADLWSYIEDNYQTNDPQFDLSKIRGVLKLYISEQDYNRLDTYETFYIKNLNKEEILSNLTNDQKIKTPIENKYRLDIYKDFNLLKTNQEVICSLKTPKENRFKRFVRLDSFNIGTNTYEFSVPDSIQNPINGQYSIDIDLGRYFAHYYNNGQFTYIDTTLSSRRIVNINNVNRLFRNTNISNSEFDKGIIDNSIIENGDFLNTNNYIKYVSSSDLDISYNNGQFTISLKNDYLNNFNTQLDVNDYVWLKGIFYNDTNNNNERVYIDGEYKISNISNDVVILDPINTISNIDNTTIFRVDETIPNYISLYTNIIKNSEIISGFLYNPNLSGNTILNRDFNNNDTEITLSNINRLRFINTLLSSVDNNIINSGVFYNSHLLNDTFNNGIIFNSIWNNINPFNNGIITKTYWINGEFNNGQFIDNLDLSLSNISFIEDQSLILNRTWNNGIFKGGTFNRSQWQDGEFNGGEFINSNALNGTFSGGRIGSRSLSTQLTTIGRDTNTSIILSENIIVVNAKIGGDGFVTINNCNFQSGELTSNLNGNTIWNNGDFNGGDITGNVKWKNGRFNNGKFLSTYDNTLTYTTSDLSDQNLYSWENGEFNGGYFGDSTTHPSWFKGEFKSGEFSGKYWKDGVFTNGIFTGNIPSNINDIFDFDTTTIGIPAKLKDIINNNYGIWLGGKITTSNYEENKPSYTKLIRKTDTRVKSQLVEFVSSLWMSGIFEHNNGTFKNSVFKSGSFNNGTFEESLFNPYTKDVLNDGSTPTFTSHDLCVWNNGVFKSGSFYYSNWNNGVWITGDMNGSVWNNGVWNNGFANNIIWKGGRWKNGVWNGSPFNKNTNVNGTTINNMTKTIMQNIWNELSTLYPIVYDNTIDVDSEDYINVYHKRDKMVKTDGKYYHINNIIDNSSITQTSAYKILSNPTSPVDSSFFDRNELTPTSTTIQSWSYDQISTGPSVYAIRSSFIPSNATSNYIIFKSKYNDVSTNTIKTDRNVFRDTSYSYKVKFRASKTVSTVGDVRLYIVMGGFTGTPGTTSTIDTGQTIYFDNSSEYSGIPYIRLNQTETSYILTYYPKESDNKELRFFVRNVSNQIVRIILKGSSDNDDLITAFRSKYQLYNPTFPNIPGNNTLVNSGVTDNTFPTLTTTEQDYLNFGNGRFISGVWENGFWDDGYNDNIQTNITFRSVLSYNKIDANNHEIIVEEVLGDNNSEVYSKYNIGDRVIISNVSAQDVNEDRIYLNNIFELRDKYIVNNRYRFKFYVRTSNNVRSIDIDSDLHNITVTKTLFLNGSVYNGLFYNTVISYLNLDGNNNTLRLFDTHIIDATINGGYVGNEVSGRRYSLIQHMNFFDNVSISKNESDFINPSTTYIPEPISTNRKYATILNLIYESEVNNTLYEASNIYQDSSYISSGNYVESKMNLNGYITRDVLSSTSKFKNLYDLNDGIYQLGYKYKEYDNYIPNDGKFTRRRFSYTTDPSDPNVNSNQFIEDGWDVTPLNSGSPFSRFTSNTNVGSVSIDNNNSDSLIMLLNNNMILENENTKQIETQRYIVFDMKISNINTTNTTYSISLTNIVPRIFLNNKSENYNIIDNSVLVNHLSKFTSNEVLNTREYFYNKQSLNMFLYYIGLTQDVIFKELSFKEINMIPFFSYYNTINIDSDFKIPKSSVELPLLSDTDRSLIDDISLIPKNIL